MHVSPLFMSMGIYWVGNIITISTVQCMSDMRGCLITEKQRSYSRETVKILFRALYVAGDGSDPELHLQKYQK